MCVCVGGGVLAHSPMTACLFVQGSNICREVCKAFPYSPWYTHKTCRLLQRIPIVPENLCSINFILNFARSFSTCKFTSLGCFFFGRSLGGTPVAQWGWLQCIPHVQTCSLIVSSLVTKCRYFYCPLFHKFGFI